MDAIEKAKRERFGRVFARLLGEWMEKNHSTQRGFILAADLREHSVTDWKLGRKIPHGDSMRKICTALGVDESMFEDDERSGDMADAKTKKKPGWEYDEEDEEILGVGESEMPETAEEALKRARSLDGGTADQLTDPRHTEYLRGAAAIYDILMYTDFEPEENEQMPLNMRQTIIQVRNQMRQEVLDTVLWSIDDLLQDFLDIEAAQRKKRGE